MTWPLRSDDSVNSAEHRDVPRPSERFTDAEQDYFRTEDEYERFVDEAYASAHHARRSRPWPSD
jgi:hypothetical protein